MATPENRRPQPPEEPETDYPWDYVKLHRVEQAFSNADREVNVYLRKKNLTIDSINEVSILPDDDVGDGRRRAIDRDQSVRAAGRRGV